MKFEEGVPQMEALRRDSAHKNGVVESIEPSLQMEIKEEPMSEDDDLYPDGELTYQP